MISFTEPCKLDYELHCPQKVRQYRINDVDTVRVGIAEHIHAFLSYHTIPKHTKPEIAKIVLGIIMTLAAVISFVIKRPVFIDNRPTYLFSAIVFLICSVINYYISRFVEGFETVFISLPRMFESFDNSVKRSDSNKNKSAKVPPEKEKSLTDDTTRLMTVAELAEVGHQPAVQFPQIHESSYYAPLITALQAKSCRISISMAPQRPVIILTAEHITNNSVDGYFSWVLPPRVIKKVTKSYNYSQFFDKNGYIYPPAVKEATISIISEAMSSEGNNNNKGRRRPQSTSSSVKKKQ
eukprot:Tbor_TRINITY_DN1203_c0_g1::TRINITY_DN1203_c0_g1_i1::g.5755::m.5755